MKKVFAQFSFNGPASAQDSKTLADPENTESGSSNGRLHHISGTGVKSAFIKSIILILLILTFPNCGHQTATYNLIKASIHSTCISVINLESDRTFVDFIAGGIQVGGFTAAGDVPGADELGVNITGPDSLIKPGIYNISDITPLAFIVYWDPGNDVVDQYGSVSSGTVEIVSVKRSNGVVAEIEVKLMNVGVINPSADQLCINDGYIRYQP